MTHTPTVRRTISGKRIPIEQERGSWGATKDQLFTETLRSRLGKLLGAPFRAAARRDDDGPERERQPGDPVVLVTPTGDGNRYGRRAAARAHARDDRKDRRQQLRTHRARVRAAWNDPVKRKKTEELALDVYQQLLADGLTPKRAARLVKQELAR